MGRRNRHGPSHAAAAAATAANNIPPQIIVEAEHPAVHGPSPGLVAASSQYTLEQQLRRMQREHGCDPSREENYRLQGVQLIDNVRQALQLPVKTFATACTYYHKFRLNFRDAEYNFQDAALAALFVACKVEDTIKKSRDVLCAAYNLKNPDKPTTPDDKLFERPSNILVGLDRLILQTVGFDFRVRYPQKLLAKLIRQLVPDGAGDDAVNAPDDAVKTPGDAAAPTPRDVLAIAYPMSIDLYKTFAPIKQTSFTMAIAVIELTARILQTLQPQQQPQLQPLLQQLHDPASLDHRFHTDRGCVVETLLDLLDLYTQFTKSTKIGTRYPLDLFIDIKIKVNQEVDDDPRIARVDAWCDQCAQDDRDPAAHPSATPGSGSVSVSATSPASSGPPLPPAAAAKLKRNEGTMRFVFDPDSVRREQEQVAAYFAVEYDEEIREDDEIIPPDAPSGPAGRGGRGGRRNHNNHSHPRNSNGNDGGWAPYPRNRNHDHRHNKPRKGSGAGGPSGRGGYY